MDSHDVAEPVPGGSRGIEARAARWLALRDRGDLGEADAAALHAWLDASPAHRVAFLRLEAAWAECGRLQALGAGLAGGPPPRGYWTRRPPILEHASLRRGGATPVAAHGADWQRLDGLAFACRSQGAPARRDARPWAAVAASLFLAATLAHGLHWQARVDTASHHAPLGSVLPLPLADGSRTVLGSDSRIDVRLSGDARRIELRQGEAFFEVAPDPDRPFVVLAGDRRVVAVGTRFSVRREDDGLRVVVTEGRVRLESTAASDQPRPTALLPAGSVVLADGDGVLVQSLPIDDAERMVGWQDGLLAFRDATLAEAAAEFNRYSARRIEIGDATAGALRIGGSFRWSNAEGFVRLLEQGFPVYAEYHDDRMVLHSR